MMSMVVPVILLGVMVWGIACRVDAWSTLVEGGAQGLQTAVRMVPSLVGLLICIAGPTFSHNGLRYALPIIFANPLLCSLSLEYPPNKQKN